MKRFDFTQTGGFPLTQDRLKWMQEGYIDALNALASLAGGSVPAVLNGVELTSGSWSTGGTVSDGWVWHPVMGLMPFVGGSFTPTTKGVSYKDVTSGLTFENNATQNVQIKRLATMAPGALNDLQDLSERRWGHSFGQSMRTGWQDLTLEAGYTGTVKYMIDRLTGLMHIRGTVTGAAGQGAMAENFPMEEVVKDLPLHYVSGQPQEFQDVYFVTALNGATTNQGNLLFLNSNGKIKPGTSDNGSVWLRGIASYPGVFWTQHFDFSFHVDLKAL